MSLNIGENFQERWLFTPQAVRQTYCDELTHICQLLEPETQLNKWQHNDALLQQKHRKIIDQAYKQLKKDLLAEQARQAEERKRQRQAELEQRIADQRAVEAARVALLMAHEAEKQQQDDLQLQQIAKDLEQELRAQSAAEIARFETSQCKQFNREKISIDELKLRLELEAEQSIEQMLVSLKAQLKLAVKEEIDLLLTQYLSSKQSNEAAEQSSD